MGITREGILPKVRKGSRHFAPGVRPGGKVERRKCANSGKATPLRLSLLMPAFRTRAISTATSSAALAGVHRGHALTNTNNTFVAC